MSLTPPPPIPLLSHFLTGTHPAPFALWLTLRSFESSLQSSLTSLPLVSPSTNHPTFAKMSGAKKDAGKKESNFLMDFALGGVSGAIAKTCTAPIERVKLIMQTQDANPRIKSGEVARYTGIVK